MLKHSEPIIRSSSKGYIQAERERLRSTEGYGYTAYGWEGDLLAWESSWDNEHPDAHAGHWNILGGEHTTHYLYEPGSFIPLLQAVQKQRIALIPLPDYMKAAMARWNNQPVPEGISDHYDQDTDPLWQNPPPAQPFDQIAFYQCDHLGTPQEMTDAHGNIIWSAHYKAWGHARTEIDPTAKAAGVNNHLRFQGQYFDVETGLHYNRHRYYDPEVGRYLSKDPIGLAGGLNLHAYVKSPTSGIDPLGLTEGSTSACSYYVDMQKKAPRCHYYKRAEQICKGNDWLVNRAVSAGIYHAHLTGRTEDSKAMILTHIREGLVVEDKAAQAAGEINQDGCTHGDIIDWYHRIVFEKSGISAFFYGGNWWWQDIWPNPVPRDDTSQRLQGIPGGLFDPY